MHQGFIMDLTQFTTEYTSDMYRRGLDIQNVQKHQVEKSINKYILSDGGLSASEIEKDWFPEINANVFLSHSHKDEKKVLELAGFLQSHVLKPFVDSFIWGYAEDLLKEINNQYNIIDRKGESITYQYNGCNYVAANVYMILNGALQKMIDNTECVIFLETPNSIKAKDARTASGITESSWIYSELLTTEFIRKKATGRLAHTEKRFDEQASVPHFEYNVVLNHLIDLPANILKNACNSCSGVDILDHLYGIMIKP